MTMSETENKPSRRRVRQQVQSIPVDDLSQQDLTQSDLTQSTAPELDDPEYSGIVLPKTPEQVIDYVPPEPITQAEPELGEFQEPPPQPEPKIVLDQRIPFPGSQFAAGDVVQILDKNSRNYGMFFTIGCQHLHKLHGYIILEGRKKEYVTVDYRHVAPIGRSKVRSEKTCSDRWLADHR